MRMHRFFGVLPTSRLLATTKKLKSMGCSGGSHTTPTCRSRKIVLSNLNGRQSNKYQKDCGPTNIGWLSDNLVQSTYGFWRGMDVGKSTHRRGRKLGLYIDWGRDMHGCLRRLIHGHGQSFSMFSLLHIGMSAWTRTHIRVVLMIVMDLKKIQTRFLQQQDSQIQGDRWARELLVKLPECTHGQWLY